MSDLILSPDLNVITDEIKNHMQKAGRAIFEIGKRQLGDNATLKQIANHVGPQFNIDAQTAMKFMLSVKGGIRS